MPRYQSLVFLQGEEANQPIDILYNRQGYERHVRYGGPTAESIDAAFAFLRPRDTGEHSEEHEQDGCPIPGGDAWTQDGYRMYAHQGLGYIGLDRVVVPEPQEALADSRTRTQTCRVQRALTGPEMTSVMTAINAAGSVPEILDAALTTVFAALLEPLGESFADYGPGRRLDPCAFSIPAAQWATISEACMARADAFGGRMHIAMELINVMPSSYDDPSAAVPDYPPQDQRPYQHGLAISREATDVIAAASRHCAELGRYFGEDSREYRDAVGSWQYHLSQVFSMAFGAQTHVSRDGDLSLLVSTASGLVYGIIFHRDRTYCTADGCKATLNDDGTTWTCTPNNTTCSSGHHVPSYPLDAPHPGSWSFHS